MLAFLIWIASWFAWIPFLITYPRHPRWLVTPDDPISPYGQYEPTVRKVYEKVGKFWGDFYWLCFRNRLYGLRYSLKPQRYKDTTDYAQYERSVTQTWYGERIVVDRLVLRVVELGNYVELHSGWKLRGVIRDPLTTRQVINMEFTPVFTIRWAE